MMLNRSTVSMAALWSISIIEHPKGKEHIHTAGTPVASPWHTAHGFQRQSPDGEYGTLRWNEDAAKVSNNMPAVVGSPPASGPHQEEQTHDEWLAGEVTVGALVARGVVGGRNYTTHWKAAEIIDATTAHGFYNAMPAGHDQ